MFKKFLPICIALLMGLFLIETSAQSSISAEESYFEYCASCKKSLTLDGAWKFKFAKTLNELKSIDYQTIPVPGEWTKHTDYHKFGYAAYETTISNPNESDLGILFPFLVLDYQIFANDELVFQSKYFDLQNPNPDLPGRMRAFFRLPQAKEIQLQVVIQNFETRSPGINLTPVVDQYDKLKYQEESRKIFEYAGIGILLIIAVYNLVLFAFLKSRSMLWLALIAFVVAARASLVYDGHFLLYYVFPSLDFLIAKKIEYGALYIAPCFAPWMYRDQFQIVKYDRVTKILFIISVGMFLAVMVLPISIFEETIILYYVIVLLCLFIAIDILRIALANKLHTSTIVLVDSLWQPFSSY